VPVANELDDWAEEVKVLLQIIAVSGVHNRQWIAANGSREGTGNPTDFCTQECAKAKKFYENSRLVQKIHPGLFGTVNTSSTLFEDV